MAGSRDGQVAIVDVAAKKVVRAIDIRTKRSNRLALTPDGALVLVSDLGTGELIVLDRASGAERARVAVAPRGIAGILVAPDSSRAYVAATADDFVAVVDLKTFAVTGKLQTGKGPDGMAWAARR